MNKTILIIFTLLSFTIFSQESNSLFKIGRTSKNGFEEYSIINQKGDTLRKLNKDKYYVTLDTGFKNFAIFGIKNKKGWSAIDINEKYLFQVYKKYIDEPYPDFLIENRIRIVDENGKIGFADENGKIVIIPQFEYVSHFHNGFAIIGSKCNKIPYPHNNESGCQHYSIKCKQYGYINKNGDIIKLGNQTFLEVVNEINWKDIEY